MPKCKSWGLIAVGLFLVGLLYWIGSHKNEQPHSGSTQDPTQSPNKSISAINGNPRTGKNKPDYKPDCSIEKYADLCAQTRMAEFAKRQSLYTLWSVWLLGATLCAAGWAAYEARRIAGITDDTAKRQLRAYVTFESGEVCFDQHSNVAIGLKFINNGQTPAYSIKTVSAVSIQHKNIPPEFDMAELSDNWQSMSIIGHGQTHIVNFGSIFSRVTEEQMVGMRRGTARCYIWGKLTYKDAFKKDRYFIFRCVSAIEIQKDALSGAAAMMHSLKWKIVSHEAGCEAN